MSELDEAATAPDEDRTRRSADNDHTRRSIDNDHTRRVPEPIPPAGGTGQIDPVGMGRAAEPAPPGSPRPTTPGDVDLADRPDPDRTRIRGGGPTTSAEMATPDITSATAGDPPAHRPAVPGSAVPTAGSPAARQHGGPAAPNTPGSPARLMPPTQAVERSRVAEQFVTRTPPPDAATGSYSGEDRWSVGTQPRPASGASGQFDLSPTGAEPAEPAGLSPWSRGAAEQPGAGIPGPPRSPADGLRTGDSTSDPFGLRRGGTGSPAPAPSDPPRVTPGAQSGPGGEQPATGLFSGPQPTSVGEAAGAGGQPNRGPEVRHPDPQPGQRPTQATRGGPSAAGSAAGSGPATASGGQPGVAAATTRPEPVPEGLLSPASIGGLGKQPEQPIVTLPPIEEQVVGYPISPRTGEPVRNWVIVASVLAFGGAAFVALASYWWYWWVAIHIESFASSARLIELFNPRPGSAVSVVLVCVMAIIGAIMTAGPAVAGYNVWHGASLSRKVGLVACGTSLLAFLVTPMAWVALPFAAIGTGLLWLPRAKAFLAAWQTYNNPERAPIKPYEKVAYGPAPRFQ